MWSNEFKTLDNLGIKKVTSVNLSWGYKETTNSGFVIDTDGNILTKNVQSNLKVVLIARRNVRPYITGAQRQRLVDIFKSLSSKAGSISITSTNGELQETALALYRNIMG